MTEIKQKYDFKKTLRKVGIITAQIFVAGVLVYITETPELIFLVPLFEGFRNWLKHKDK
jgi:hypothetical protein